MHSSFNDFTGGQPTSHGSDKGGSASDECAEVAALIEHWVPEVLRSEAPDVIAEVMPVTRRLVSAMNPTTKNDFGRFMRAVAAFLLWARLTRGTIRVETVLDPDTVEFFVNRVNRHQKRAWKHTTRRSLRQVGPVVNPRCWPVVSEPLGSHETTAPYSLDVEEAFKMAGASMLLRGRPQEAWVVVGSGGVGLSGAELREGHPDDLRWLTKDRLALRVGGRHPRLVPIRSDYTDLALEAARLAGNERFIPATGHNVVYKTANRVAVQGLGSWSYRRGRSTWLTAHLIAGTPLAALRVIAGPLSMRTLNDLIGPASQQITAEAAAHQGLLA